MHHKATKGKLLSTSMEVRVAKAAEKAWMKKLSAHINARNFSNVTFKKLNAVLKKMEIEDARLYRIQAVDDAAYRK